LDDTTIHGRSAVGFEYVCDKLEVFSGHNYIPLFIKRLEAIVTRVKIEIEIASIVFLSVYIIS
jgi:hypothetical protein